MALLPTNQHTTIAAVDRAVAAAADDGLRPHLGASLIGGPCDRALWYSFRWALVREHSARVLRLFARGVREERAQAAYLRAAGIEVLTADPATGKQFEFSAIGGHFGGSMDGALPGVIESPKKWHVWECKTHSLKSFEKLRKEGVRKAKPEHWAQMVMYMHWSKMDRALYWPVCKDNDEILPERLEADNVEALKLTARAQRIIEAQEPPLGVSTDPAWYQCKICDYADICHGEKLPRVSCRTCLHSTPETDGTRGRWSCAHWKADDIPLDAQKRGCDEHRYIPALVKFARPVNASADENWVEYEMPSGQHFRNGDKGANAFNSIELAAIPPSMIGDANVECLREQFGAVVGRIVVQRVETV